MSHLLVDALLPLGSLATESRLVQAVEARAAVSDIKGYRLVVGSL
jgi:hypothetical protein